MQVDRDPVTGQTTTGHEWDGLKELNTPVPRVSVWAMRSAILFSICYWVLYPAWPVAFDYTRGLLGYSSRAVVTEKVEAATAEIAAFEQPLLDGDLNMLAEDPVVRATFEPAAAVLFLDNCAMCHRRSGMGQRGFPNLTDETWLWSGTAEEIHQTLLHGINYPEDEDTRIAQMPAFGAMEMLEENQIADVIAYVRKIAGYAHDTEALGRGAEIFAENCAACHGDAGEGGLGIGAPSLIDQAWIYGPSHEDLTDTIVNGRAGVMPGWTGRLSEAEIRQLALYVVWLGRPVGE